MFSSTGGLFTQADFESWNSGATNEPIETKPHQEVYNVSQIDWKRLRSDKDYQYVILKHMPDLCRRVNIIGGNYRSLLHDDFTRIRDIQNPTTEMYQYALGASPAAMDYINVELPYTIYKQYLKDNPKQFNLIKNPSHAVCKYAITVDPYNIRYIANQTYELQLRAIRIKPMAIRHCERPTKRLKWIAIHKNPWTIQYIENRSQTMVLVAIQLAIQHNAKSLLIDRVPDKFTVAKDYMKLMRT